MSQLSSTNATNKQLDFWYRAKKQYQNGAKPFVYQFNLLSTQPKPKKFMIIINKFIDILKDDMKQQYSSQQQLKDNYWNELQKHYKDQYEMSYIIESAYQKKKNMLKLYFCLLLHNKKIFQEIRQITQQLKDMYNNPEEKLQRLDQLFQSVDYLKDGKYTIMSQFVQEYDKYEEKKREEEKLRQKALQKERKQQEQKEKQAKQKLSQELKIKKQKQQLEKLRILKQEKQKQQRQRKQRQNKNKQIPNSNKNITSSTNSNPPAKQTPTPTQPLDDSIAFIPQNYKAQNRDQKALIIQQRRKDNKTTLQEWTNRAQNNIKKHLKNSQVLYQQKYKDQFQVFTFRMDPQIDNTQIQRNKDKCFQCGVELKHGFYFLWGNQNQCMYTGEWFCNEHMAEERISIPWKAMKYFDLRGYPVSKKAYFQIKSYYQKPIIQIRNDNPIIKHSPLLYEFLVLKRQIHLMYDSICDLQLMQPLLKKKLNYCLKQNLFSLKNLYDIYNSHQTPSLQRQYEILSKHFYRCQRCQKRKGYNCPKCKDPVKIFAFQLKQTFGCINCKKLYHKGCLTSGKCDCQDQ